MKEYGINQNSELKNNNNLNFKKMAKQTSIDALLKQVREGKILTNNAKVLHYIIQNPFSTRVEISKDLNLLENTINPTLANLEDMGLVITPSTREERGSMMGCYVFVPDSETQEALAIKRASDKAVNWIKSGLKNHSSILDDDMIESLKSLHNKLVPF